MHYRDAQAAFTPTHFDNVVPFSRTPMVPDERQHIQNKIQAKQSQIAQLAQEIRWLRLELESDQWLLR
jgi:hypothetical protein